MLLEPLRRGLARQGYRAINWRYPSLRGSIEMHAAQLAAKAKELDDNDAVERLHFVGHSMGAIVVRSALAMQRPRKLGRVVLLAPPNRGARLADLALRTLWAVARCGERALLTSRQLREWARSGGRSRLRNHRGVMGSCRLAGLDALARRTRSHHPSRPAHAPAALARTGAGGALPARRPLPACGRLRCLTAPTDARRRPCATSGAENSRKKIMRSALNQILPSYDKTLASNVRGKLRAKLVALTEFFRTRSSVPIH